MIISLNSYSFCFADWIIWISDKTDIDKIKDVSIVNDSLNNSDIVSNVQVLWTSVLRIMKTVINWILIVFLVYIWVSMIISMWTNEERLSWAKKQVYYALTWLLFINIPDMLLLSVLKWNIDGDWNFVIENSWVTLNSDVSWFTSSWTSVIWNSNFSQFVWGTIISFMEVLIFWIALFMFIIAWIKIIWSRWKRRIYPRLKIQIQLLSYGFSFRCYNGSLQKHSI